jgi:hypothetical protein
MLYTRKVVFYLEFYMVIGQWLYRVIDMFECELKPKCLYLHAASL